MDIRKVSVAEFFAVPGAAELIDAYRKECTAEGVPMGALNVDFYKALEAMGRLSLAVGVYEHKAVGFIATLMIRPPHCNDILVATTDSVYVLPEHRLGFNGARLLWWARDDAKAAGCLSFNIIAPTGSVLEKLAMTIGKRTSSTYKVEFKHADRRTDQ